MTSLRGTVLHTGILCVAVVTIAVSGTLEAAFGAPSGESMSSAQPQESRVPLDLFKTWNFDTDAVGHAPAGFSSATIGSADTPTWVVKHDPTAQSPPHLLGQSASCRAEDCFQILLVDTLKYEYLDLIVRIRLGGAPESNGAAGVIFGARDRQNFYIVTVNVSGQGMNVIRVQDGKATTLAQDEVTSKKVAWHHLRVRRNTIISKEYIEVFLDGVQVFSVEDKTFGIGQIGLVTRGRAMVDFDNLTAAPLYSQKPISGPAAY